MNASLKVARNLFVALSLALVGLGYVAKPARAAPPDPTTCYSDGNCTFCSDGTVECDCCGDCSIITCNPIYKA